MTLPPLIAAHFENHRSEVKTPIEEWFDRHPGVPLEAWIHAMSAVQEQQSDWAYRNGPLNISEVYDGKDGWWL